jgi:hypothetical protein
MIEFVDQKVILNNDEYHRLMLNEKLILMKLKKNRKIIELIEIKNSYL